MNSFFVTTNKEYSIPLSKVPPKENGATHAALESTDNIWMRIHGALEENGIDTILVNPYKTKIMKQKPR